MMFLSLKEVLKILQFLHNLLIQDKWVDKNNWIDREDREWTEAKERDPWEEPEDRKPMDKDRMWLEPTSVTVIY